jgi:hypothetical protein
MTWQTQRWGVGSVKVWEKLVEAPGPLVLSSERQEVGVCQESVQKVPGGGGARRVQGVAQLEADAGVEAEAYLGRVGLFFKGRGGEGDGEGVLC